MQKQPYFGRNNCLSAEIRIFRQKLLFGQTLLLPDLAYASRLVRYVMQDGGRNFSIWQSHIILVHLGVEIATAYFN